MIRLWILLAAVKEFMHLFEVSVLDNTVYSSLMRNNVKAQALKVGRLRKFVDFLCKEPLRTKMVVNKTFEDSGFDSIKLSVRLTL